MPRRRALGLPPAEHRSRLNEDLGQLDALVKSAQIALEGGHCAGALRQLVKAAHRAGTAEAHAIKLRPISEQNARTRAAGEKVRALMDEVEVCFRRAVDRRTAAGWPTFGQATRRRARRQR